MLDIIEMVDGARYSTFLNDVINELKGVKVLRLEYESDYQGFVDIDVLLENGKVFSYMYNYGSCSGCDTWEAEEYNDEQIKQIMLKDSTTFDNIELYNKWRLMVEDKNRGKLT